MNSTDIASIIKTLTESGFEEAELKVEDFYLKVSSRAGVTESVSGATGEKKAAVATEARQASPGAVAGDDAVSYATVNSPTLGTFYRAPSPGADPFVKIGDRVVVGQQVGIVEVMKLFNSIDSDVSGTVVEVLAADGELVEHGQALFSIAVDPA